MSRASSVLSVGPIRCTLLNFKRSSDRRIRCYLLSCKSRWWQSSAAYFAKAQSATLRAISVIYQIWEIHVPFWVGFPTEMLSGRGCKLNSATQTAHHPTKRHLRRRSETNNGGALRTEKRIACMNSCRRTIRPVIDRPHIKIICKGGRGRHETGLRVLLLADDLPPTLLLSAHHLLLSGGAQAITRTIFLPH